MTSTRSSRREHIRKVTRAIALAAMAAGACFGTGNAFAQSCIEAFKGGAPGGQGGTFIAGTPNVPCTITGEVKVFIDEAVSTTSTGDVGSQHGTHGLVFTSNDTVRFANGWSTIHPTDFPAPNASFPNLNILAVPGRHFTDLTFDLQMADLAATNLTVATFDGTIGEGSFGFTGLPHSTDLRFDILNPTGLTAVDLTATSPSGIHEVKQIQVSGFTGVVKVPEPSTFALMALGVVGVGLAGLRRTRRTRLGT